MTENSIHITSIDWRYNWMKISFITIIPNLLQFNLYFVLDWHSHTYTLIVYWLHLIELSEWAGWVWRICVYELMCVVSMTSIEFVRDVDNDSIEDRWTKFKQLSINFQFEFNNYKLHGLRCTQCATHINHLS